MIPKYLLRPGMPAEEKKRMEEWVKSKRKIMSKYPAHEDVKDAIAAAVKMDKEENLAIASVWKEPEDIGEKYEAVHMKDRENAYISGYVEKVGLQEIFDIANGNKRERIEEIEEE